MVAQFDVCPNPNPDSRDSHPYLVSLQANALSDLNTRIVAPLIPEKSIPLFERLTPLVSVEGKRYIVDVTNLGVVLTKTLPAIVTNLEPERDNIIAALDLVFTGI